MKKALLTLMCIAAMMAAGTGLKAQEVTIVLMPGYTWISIPSTDTLNFATALGSFTPMAGDVIKSQWGNAFYRNGQWYGNITHFYPGHGYHYYSNRNVPVMLTFNVQQPTPQVVVTTSEPTDITVNSATFGGNVTSSDGNFVFVFLRGICWATHPNPTFNDNYIEAGNGLGSFTVSLAELTLNTTFYIRAFAVTTTGTIFGDEVSYTTLTGAINGLFSVSENQQVYFSQGNLQYIGSASTPYWKFAENQWDCFGTTTGQNSSYQNVDRDLFGWGTSGYNHGATYYQPYSTYPENSYYYAYGDYLYNLYDQTGQADWGFNAISNGGNQENQWRTLTHQEWNYVFFYRATTSNIYFAKAQVNNVNGVILLPDNWSSSTYNLNNPNNGDASYSSNILTASQWTTLENAGAVFLPAAGLRNWNSMDLTGRCGEYWSASYYNNNSGFAYSVGFAGSYLGTDYSGNRSWGISVRLVRDEE